MPLSTATPAALVSFRRRAPHHLALPLLALLLLPAAGAAQMSKPAQQPLQLPDPTPRPPDLEKQYSSDPLASKKVQASQQARGAVRRRQAMEQSTHMLQVAEALKNDTIAHRVGGPTVPDAMKAAEIEKTARALKELLKQP